MGHVELIFMKSDLERHQAIFAIPNLIYSLYIMFVYLLSERNQITRIFIRILIALELGIEAAGVNRNEERAGEAGSVPLIHYNLA